MGSRSRDFRGLNDDALEMAITRYKAALVRKAGSREELRAFGDALEAIGPAQDERKRRAEQDKQRDEALKRARQRIRERRPGRERSDTGRQR